MMRSGVCVRVCVCVCARVCVVCCVGRVLRVVIETFAFNLSVMESLWKISSRRMTYQTYISIGPFWLQCGNILQLGKDGCRETI